MCSAATWYPGKYTHTRVATSPNLATISPAQSSGVARTAPVVSSSSSISSVISATAIRLDNSLSLGCSWARPSI
jgi:hypothetical protein